MVYYIIITIVKVNQQHVADLNSCIMHCICYCVLAYLKLLGKFMFLRVLLQISFQLGLFFLML